MTRIEIIPLLEDHLEDAAALVSQRYVKLRECVPHLPARYADRNIYLPMLLRSLASGPGVAALKGSELVGFLSAFRIPGFRGLPAVISPEWGNGARLDDSPRIYEAMYTALSPKWVADGRVVHLVMMFANDHAAIDGWHMLGFGNNGADAVRNLQPVPDAPTDVEIRRGKTEDAAALRELERGLVAHLAAPPTYLVGGEVRSLEECANLLANPDYAVWLAEHNGDPVAYLLIGPASRNASTIIVDEGTSSITGAFTRPETRGTGIATALLNRALAWAKERGYVRCAVDFETMNPQARRFWLRHFTASSYGLERIIDAGAVPGKAQRS